MAIIFTCLVGAAGIGIDSGSLAYERSRIQHSADAGAMAIAYDCVNKKVECSEAGGVVTAAGFAEQNSKGGSVSVPGGVSPAAGTVLVKVDKTVNTNFFKLLGVSTKNVKAQSRATWTDHPVAGDVLPFAISLCEYSKLPLGTATVINTVVEKNYGPMMKGLLAIVYPLLAPSMQTCSVPAGLGLSGNPSSVTTLPGGLWMSDNGSSTNNGKLIPTQILDTLEAGANFNMNQRGKFATHLAVGKMMPFAIYAPTGNYSHGGLHVNGLSTNGDVDLKLVGYAPFVVSGWCLDIKSNGTPTDCGGAAPSSAGIAGKFISTSQRIPDFDYGSAGAGFGAALVKLTE